jgi:histidine triad (HIT) family protein
MLMDCIFCRIARGEIPTTFLYKDEDIMAFRDIHPLAPVHILVMPVKHIPNLAQIAEADLPLMGKMVKVANHLAKNEGILELGYRLVINTGKEGGQVVPHLHLHLLGGRQLHDRLS